MKTNYQGYFKNHYKSTLSESDITTYTKWFHTQWRIIKRNLIITPETRILEIGSGFGGVYEFLRREGTTNYLGIELDDEIVSFANSHFKTNVFHVTSIEDLEDTRGFDLIFAFEVLEHIENPSAAIEKITSLLKPGGTFCGTTPYPYKKNVLADSTHLSVLHPLNWKRLFEQADFTSVSLRPLSFFPVLWRINKVMNLRLPIFLPFTGFISTCLIIATKD